MEKRHFTYVAIGVLVWALLGTIVAAHYFVQYNTYRGEYVDLAKQLKNVSLEASILLSYGNGTKVWYNNTVLPLSSTAFAALNYTAKDFEYTDYGGDLGILVTSINGLPNNSTQGWFYWTWDSQNLKWTLPEYSAAKHILHEGDMIAYTYTSYLEWPPPPPT